MIKFISKNFTTLPYTEDRIKYSPKGGNNAGNNKKRL